MKIEHMEAIERAKRHGVMPSVLAHELLVRDLVDAAMFEWQNIAAPYSKLNEGQRQEVTDRVTEKVTTAVYTAVGIISSRSVDTIPLTVADAKFKAKSITVTATIDAQDPNRHGLIDVAGKLCLLVLAPNDYAEGLDSLTVERDQRDLPLHVSNLTGGLFGGGTGPDEPDGVKHPLGTEEELNALVNAGKSGGVDDDQIGSKDPLYNEAVEQLIAYGRLGAAAIAGALSISNERHRRCSMQWSSQAPLLRSMAATSSKSKVVLRQKAMLRIKTSALSIRKPKSSATSATTTPSN